MMSALSANADGLEEAVSADRDPRDRLARLTAEDLDQVLDLAGFDADGLIPAIVQDAGNGQVLMLAWMDREALRRTLAEGRVTYWSRSRQEYWRKGDTSGNIQVLRSAALDCDADALLISVEQTGAACHTGTRSCFDERTIPLSPKAAG